MLAPIYDEGADKVAKDLEGYKVVLGKVDCDNEGSLGTRFHITKYPTIKYVQSGVVAKKEYRGQRSAEAFVEFVREHVKDPILEFHNLDQLKELEEKKRHVIGYFADSSGPEYANLKKVSVALKEDCSFHAGFGPMVDDIRGEGNLVTFRSAKGKDASEDQVFSFYL